jgi:hypothetical protein
MKGTRAIFALSLAAVFAGGASAMAADSTSDNVNNTNDDQSIMDPATDQTGAAIFGFTIANAGNTPEAVQQFLAGLTPEQRQSVQTGCTDVLKDGSLQSNTTVVTFCHNATAS